MGAASHDTRALEVDLLYGHFARHLHAMFAFHGCSPRRSKKLKKYRPCDGMGTAARGCGRCTHLLALAAATQQQACCAPNLVRVHNA